jgi:transcriptional regulator with PAS, ATPase and Fis domain
MKSMLPKQKSYIPRFALLINSLWAYDDPNSCCYELIGKESVLKAEKLSNYFINMSKKVKIDSKDNIEIKKTIKAGEGKSKQDIFKSMFIENPELNRSQVAEMLDVSRRTLLNWIKTIDSNGN